MTLQNATVLETTLPFRQKEEAMEERGCLAKQEKLLGFDHAEVTKTRDLLNEILSERATPHFSRSKRNF